MSCSDVSNRVLNERLSSDGIADDAYVFSSPMRAGYRIHWPKHTAVDGTRTPTAVKPPLVPVPRDASHPVGGRRSAPAGLSRL